MLARGILLAAIALTAACRRPQDSPAPVSPRQLTSQLQGQVAGSTGADPLRRPAWADRQAPLSQCPSRSNPLSAARSFYSKGKYQEALACAAEATALMPEQSQAHSERAAALAALGRLEDAQLAYALALGLNPNDVDSLLGAAHLYAVTLPSNRERDDLARIYAERGLSLPEVRANKKLRAQFALISAIAFNDLGQAREALDRADYVLSSDPTNSEALYERAVALFELCRFGEAKGAFTTLLKDPDRGAHAHHHLGLLLEREEKWKQAEDHFTKARRLAPSEFWEPQLLAKEVFEAELLKALSELPEDMRRDLSGIPVSSEELPVSNDLISGDPPLSPAILGLFRGPPLGESCTPAANPPCRSVALYRRNLARVAKTRDELNNQIRVTLLHEIGHLRGEDDLELAARGLE
jgi:tetratricopeptide (TPR) repeat protein